MKNHFRQNTVNFSALILIYMRPYIMKSNIFKSLRYFKDNDEIK